MAKKFLKTRKGLSTVVATLLLVLLTVVLVGVVWAAMKGLVEDELPEQGCMEIYEKVKINNPYTCYNTATGEMFFSVTQEDVDISKAILTMYFTSSSKNVEITKDGNTDDYLRFYTDSNYGGTVTLPGPNSGLTYAYGLTAQGINDVPDSVAITPVIGREPCSISDSIEEVYTCP